VYAQAVVPAVHEALRSEAAGRNAKAGRELAYILYCVCC
jgi:hypothetical protein